MTENGTEKQSQKMIRVDLSKSLDLVGLPLLKFEKDGMTLRFLLDTGASMNLIRREILDHFQKDVQQLPQKVTYYGLDNVCHESHMYAFTFNLADYTYCEVFQVMQNADALTFDLEPGSLEVHGILSSQFFMKHKACFSFETMEMFFAVPENHS